MLTKNKAGELIKYSLQMKIEVLRMINHLGVGHLGGSLSITDLLAVLYGKQMKVNPEKPDWKERDWLVCSKGHAGPAVYAALALKGYFPREELITLNQPGTNFPSHCDRNKTIGVDMTTGSLGQGASTAAGVALAHKMDHLSNYIYLILGDGECDEGQVWEMALFAAQFKLDHLIAFVDYNHLQLDGPTREIMDIGDVTAKFHEFGWYSQEINGHDLDAIDAAVIDAKANNGGRPSMIVLNTIKGHGWSAIEGKTSCHSMGVTDEELKEAEAEIQVKMQRF